MEDTPVMRSARLAWGLWSTAGERGRAQAGELWGDADVTRYIGGPLSEAGVRERLDREAASQAEHGVQYWPIYLAQAPLESLGAAPHVGCCGLRVRVPPATPAHATGIATDNTSGKDSTPPPLEYELGVHLRPGYVGKGYGTEAAQRVVAHAFGALGATALFAGHHPDNTASKRLLRRLGFQYTHDELYPPTGRLHPSYRLERPQQGPDPSDKVESLSTSGLPPQLPRWRTGQGARRLNPLLCPCCEKAITRHLLNPAAWAGSPFGTCRLHGLLQRMVAPGTIPPGGPTTGELLAALLASPEFVGGGDRDRLRLSMFALRQAINVLGLYDLHVRRREDMPPLPHELGPDALLGWIRGEFAGRLERGSGAVVHDLRLLVCRTTHADKLARLAAEVARCEAAGGVAKRHTSLARQAEGAAKAVASVQALLSTPLKEGAKEKEQLKRARLPEVLRQKELLLTDLRADKARLEAEDTDFLALQAARSELGEFRESCGLAQLEAERTARTRAMGSRAAQTGLAFELVCAPFVQAHARRRFGAAALVLHSVVLKGTSPPPRASAELDFLICTPLEAPDGAGGGDGGDGARPRRVRVHQVVECKATAADVLEAIPKHRRALRWLRGGDVDGHPRFTGAVLSLADGSPPVLFEPSSFGVGCGEAEDMGASLFVSRPGQLALSSGLVHQALAKAMTLDGFSCTIDERAEDTGCGGLRVAFAADRFAPAFHEWLHHTLPGPAPGDVAFLHRLVDAGHLWALEDRFDSSLLASALSDEA